MIDFSMDFLKTNINDIISYILLAIIYIIHTLNSKQVRMNSLLFKNDMTKKVDNTWNNVEEVVSTTRKEVKEIVDTTVDTVKNYVDKATSDVLSLTKQVTVLKTELENIWTDKITALSQQTDEEINALKTKLEKLQSENQKLKAEFVRSIKHNDELCRRGVTKQITQNLKEGKENE